MSNFDKFKDITEGRTKGLLIIITKNTCLNILKRKKVVEFVSFDDEVGASSDENLIEDLIVTNDSYFRLLKVITDLDEKYSSVFQLKFIYGFTDLEIAKLLNISNEVVRVRIFRAKKMIKKQIKSEELSYE